MQLLLTIASLSSLILLLVAFLYSFFAKNNNVFFVVLPACMLSAVIIGEVLGKGESNRKLIVLTLVVVWAVRLLARMLQRLRSPREDVRFSIIKNTWGKWFVTRTFFELYVLFGCLIFILSLPVLLVSQYGGGSLNALDYLGMILWLCGFLTETKADVDLDRFIRTRENPSRVLKEGLWSLTRHPNYFGELLEWLGVSLIAFSVLHGYLSLIIPILFFIGTYFVAVPLMDKEFEGNGEYDEYKKQTPKLVPKLPTITPLS
jgi:steroid 5-alpha reductase family enzyme